MNHKELEVWKSAMVLARSIYKVAVNFPIEERYGLSSQIKRSAVSVPSNIAEGCGRDSDPQLLYFLSVASGSLSELETQLILAEDLILNEPLPEVMDELIQVRKLLSGFKKYIQSKTAKPNPKP